MQKNLWCLLIDGIIYSRKLVPTSLILNPHYLELFLNTLEILRLRDTPSILWFWIFRIHSVNRLRSLARSIWYFQRWTNMIVSTHHFLKSNSGGALKKRSLLENSTNERFWRVDYQIGLHIEINMSVFKLLTWIIRMPLQTLLVHLSHNPHHLRLIFCSDWFLWASQCSESPCAWPVGYACLYRLVCQGATK